MRALTRAVSALLAAALLAAALVTVLELARAALDDPPLTPWPTVRRWMRETSLSDGGAVAASAGLAGLGVLLVLLGVWPRRPAALRLAATVPHVAAGTTRRSLQRALEAAAGSVDGVAAAAVRITRRAVRVEASPDVHAGPEVRSAVEERVVEALGRIALARPLAVQVRLTGAPPRSGTAA